jgi:uncharacterized hydrophobic protein (TIGR00271 family)
MEAADAAAVVVDRPTSPAEYDPAAVRSTDPIESLREEPEPEHPAGRPRRALTVLGDLLRRSDPSRRVMSDEERAVVTGELFFDGEERRPYLWRFFILIVLSTLIAALGLVANSVAVIIGAMLVAPLMTPILAVAASLLLTDIRRVVVSVLVIVAGTALAIGTGMFVTWLGLGTFTTTAANLPHEILGRTQPSLLDLGVAVAAGLAGGYVLTHPRASSSLPGVAIAVALVPPLATVGILLQIGESDLARGALLLFATNLVAIVLSAIVVMLASGFVPHEIRFEAIRSARIGLLVTLALLIAVAVPLTIHTVGVVQDQRFGVTVTRAVARWDPNSTIERLDADLKPGNRAEVDLIVATTSRQPQPSWKLAEALSAEIGRTVEVTIRYRVEDQDAATSG